MSRQHRGTRSRRGEEKQIVRRRAFFERQERELVNIIGPTELIYFPQLKFSAALKHFCEGEILEDRHGRGTFQRFGWR